LVLSILWIFGLGAILAIIFSVRARRDIRQSRGRVTGDGLAIAGMVIGIVSLVATVFFWSTLLVATN
jgi:peptidoglycan/LPS O-acetylase OafA/YrhL